VHSNESFMVFVGWLIDGTGDPAKQHMIISVADGLVRSIRPAKQADMYAPGLVNFSNCTIVPAMLDCHVHLCMSGTTDEEKRRSQLNSSYLEAEKAIEKHLLEHLWHGIVAVRDGGDYGGHNLRFKLEKLPDKRLPIHVLTPGKAWRSRGRYGRIIGRPPLEDQNLAEAIAQRSLSADHVKIVNSGVNSLSQFGKLTHPQFSEEELTAAVRRGQKIGLKAMVHANGPEPVRSALQAGCHSIEHGFFMGRENLEWMADRQVFWVPTAYSMKAYAETLGNGNVESHIAKKNLDHQLEQISQARRLDIPVVVGTDSGGLGIDHGQALTAEMRLLMEAGYPLEHAIRAATLDAAKLLGLEMELGTIKKGMPATFLVANGAPACLPETLCPPERVYIRGKLWTLPALCP